jgi:hypothetical protein
VLKDYYNILGVPWYAPLEEIRKAYLEKIQFYHPDRWQDNPHMREKAEQQTKELNAAYELLGDPVNRGEYDSSLTKNRGTDHGQHHHGEKRDVSQDRNRQIELFNMTKAFMLWREGVKLIVVSKLMVITASALLDSQFFAADSWGESVINDMIGIGTWCPLVGLVLIILCGEFQVRSNGVVIGCRLFWTIFPEEFPWSKVDYLMVDANTVYVKADWSKEMRKFGPLPKKKLQQLVALIEVHKKSGDIPDTVTIRTQVPKGR